MNTPLTSKQKLQRYEMVGMTRCGEAWQELEEDDTGDWVRFEDYETLQRELLSIRTVVNAQAEDGGLWFVPVHASEDYLQRALRRLHSAIENATSDEEMAHKPATRQSTGAIVSTCMECGKYNGEHLPTCSHVEEDGKHG